MKTIILAAGYATRLYPLTENFPKPLLTVGSKTILDWLIDDIDQMGLVDEYLVVTNHKFAHHFITWAGTREQRITVVDDLTTSNETRLGAVRDIQLAIDRIAERDGSVPELLVIAGDNLLDFSLQEFLAYAKEKQTSCIMRFEEPSVEKLRKCGVVEVDENDLVVSMEEKPQEPRSTFVSPPFYYYTQADAALVARALASGCNADAPGSFTAWLTAQTAVHAMLMPGRRYDIGNLESYKQVQQEYHGII